MTDILDIHGGHRERLRNRIAAGGLDRLEPHEVLEFLLYYAIARQDVNHISHALLDRFGSLEAVLAAEIPELMKVEGVGKKAAEWLAMVGESSYLCSRIDASSRVSLENFMQVFVYACKKYRTVQPPCCMQLCLDMDSRLSYERIICESRAWGEPETLKEALSDAVSLRARNVMILQFLGNMHAEPDEYDIRHAEEYAYALSSAGSGLLDVVLIGDGGIASMRQLGHIPDYTDYRMNRIICERYLEDFPAGSIILPSPEEEDEEEVRGIFDV